jgi:exodeoxyribonuclease V alpha subunit
MPLSLSHNVMLTRNLVYTGLTRAQEIAVLVGDQRALAAAIRRTDAARRFTMLSSLLAGSPSEAGSEPRRRER